MIIIQLAGGLGNQMQQYALYEKFISLGRECKLDISWFTDHKNQENVYASRKLELDYFPNVTYQVCSEEEKRELLSNSTIVDKVLAKVFTSRKKVFCETEIYHPEIFEFEDMYLQGYFACQKYYDDIMDTLCQRFTFPESINPENERMANEMQNGTSVSVHIRRGDYLDAVNQKMFGNICTDSYYKAAITRMKITFPDARFYLFSDDMDYVRKNYSGEEYIPVEINSGEDSYFDIYLMSHCKHNICANSTFSLWGARLNQNKGAVKIRPLKHKNSQNPTVEEMRNYWRGWEIIDAQGTVVR